MRRCIFHILSLLSLLDQGFLDFNQYQRGSATVLIDLIANHTVAISG